MTDAMISKTAIVPLRYDKERGIVTLDIDTAWLPQFSKILNEGARVVVDSDIELVIRDGNQDRSLSDFPELPKV